MIPFGFSPSAVRLCGKAFQEDKETGVEKKEELSQVDLYSAHGGGVSEEGLCRPRWETLQVTNPHPPTLDTYIHFFHPSRNMDRHVYFRAVYNPPYIPINKNSDVQADMPNNP